MNQPSTGFFDKPMEYSPLPEPTLNKDFSNIYNRDQQNQPVSNDDLPPLLKPTDSIEQALKDFSNQAPSFQTKTTPVLFDWNSSQADRYVNSDYYKQLGFDPYSDNETKYAHQQTFWDTMKNSFAGSGMLAWNTFKDGWQGWGRMVDSIFSRDLTKLMGSPEELEELNRIQKEIFNKYAIYRTPESDDSIFNRQFLGNLIQQGGFALGALGQYVSEELLTMGASTIFKPLTGARLIHAGLATAELNKDLVNAGSLYKEMGFMRKMYENLKTEGRLIAERLPIPGKGNLINDIRTAKKAGANTAELAGITLNGLRRLFSEANMGFTEAKTEAAGTHADMVEILTNKTLKEKGEISPEDEIRIQVMAQKAAWDNWKVNSGVITIMNRLQFDNLFSTFGSSKRILREMAENGEKAFLVTGKAARDITDSAGKILTSKGQRFTQVYEKGHFPVMGNYNKIAQDFGKRTANWEAIRHTAKSMFKWEVSEGIQELIQEGSNVAVKDYYTDLFNGDPASFNKSYKKGVYSQLNFDGWKTFLMGAVTGKLMSPFSIGLEKGFELFTPSADRAAIKVSRQQAIDTVNAFLAHPSRFAPEWLANTKVQNRAAEKMEEAIANGSKYEFENAKDSAFAKTVISAINLGILPGLTKTIRDIGTHFNEQQLREGFGIDINSDRKSSSQYMNSIADNIEQFAHDVSKLREKYSDRIQPEKYAENDRESLELAKRAFNDTIEIMATTKFKSGRAGERALEIIGQAAKIPGMQNSSHQIFKVLGDDLALSAEISMLKTEVQTDKDAVPSPSINDRIKRKEKELAALQKIQEIRALKPKTEEEARKNSLQEKDLIANYAISVNQTMGITSQINSEDLDDYQLLLGDYRKLGDDQKAYADNYSLLANNNYLSIFKRYHEGLKALQNEAVAPLIKLIEDANKASDSTKNEVKGNKTGEQNSTNSNGQTTTTNSTGNGSSSTTNGKNNNTQKTSEEIIEIKPEQPYINPDHGFKEVTYRIKLQKDEAGKIIRLEYFNKDIAKPQVTVDTSFSTIDEFSQYLSLLTQLAYFSRLANGGLKQSITKIESESSRNKGGKAIAYKQVISAIIKKGGENSLSISIDPETLNELTEDQVFDPGDKEEQKENYHALQQAIKEHLISPLQLLKKQVSQSALQTKQSTDPKFKLDGNQTVKVFTINGKTEADIRTLLRTFPKQELLNKLQVRISRNPAGKQKELLKKGNSRILSNPSPLNMELLYDGKTVGYLSHPDAIVTEINGNIKKIIDLSPLEFAQLFETKSTLAEIKAAYNSSLALVNAFESVLGNQSTLTIKSEDLDKFLFIDVSPGEYDFTDITRPLNELSNAGNEVISIIDKLLKDQPLVLSSSLNETEKKVNEAIRLMQDNNFEDLTKNQGRYSAMIRMPNGIIRFVELVSSTMTPDNLDSLFVQIKDQVEKTIQENVEIDSNKKRIAVDNSYNTVFNDNILNGRFFLALPQEYKGIYTSFEITPSGELQVTFYDKKNTQQDRHYIYVNNLVNEKGTFKWKGFKEFLSQINLSITNYNTVKGTNLPNIKLDYFKNSISKNATYNELINQVTNVSPSVVKNINLFVFSNQKALTPIDLPGSVGDIEKGNKEQKKGGSLLGNIDQNSIRKKEDVIPDENTKNPQPTSAQQKLTELNQKEAEEKAALKSKYESNGIITDTISYTRELKVITDNYKQQKQALATKGNDKKIALKITKGYDLQDVEDLKTFKNWVSKNLPSFISVTDLDSIAARLSDNKITLGRFLLKAKTLNNGIKQHYGEIETLNENAYKYHEAFHAVFRLLLKDTEIDTLLNSARYFASRELQNKGSNLETAKRQFQKLHPLYESLNHKDLEERFLEEWLADEFDSWKQQQSKNNTNENIITGFFRKLISFIRSLFKAKDTLPNLFAQIDKGRFRNSQVVDNRFTKEVGTLSPVELYKIEYDVDYVSDSNGNTIELKKYLSESDTNKIVGGVVNTFLRRTEGMETYNKRELLEQILNEYQRLYLSKAYNNLTAAQVDRLEMFKSLFSESQPREDIINSADIFLTMLGFNQDIDSDEFESLNDDLGDSRSTDFWNEAHSYGGFKSLSGYVRKYIQSISFEGQDEFGNEYLNDETGERLQVGVNAGIVYNGLLKISAGVTSADKFIKRLLIYKNENPESRAFVDKFIADTGLIFNEADNSYSANKDPRLFNAIYKSFSLFQVDFMTLRVHPGVGMDMKLANRRDAAANQYNRWQNAFIFNYQDRLATKPSLKIELQNILRSLYVPFQITSTLNDEELELYTGKQLASLQQLTGIKISAAYYRYSIIKHLQERKLELTSAQQNLLDSFTDVDPINSEDIAELTRTINAGENPFVNFENLNDNTDAPIPGNIGNDNEQELGDPSEIKKGEEEIKANQGKGNETRLRKIAKNNALFDETVLATSWINAEGKSVWSHQLPTFHLTFLEDCIKDPAKLRDLVEKDPYLQGTYFGKQVVSNDPSSRFMAILKSLNIKRIDGLRQITGNLTTDGRLVENKRLEYNKKEGVTYGDFKNREFIMALIGLYMEPEGSVTDIPENLNSNNRVRKITNTRHIIRVLEASNTGDTINLPVINAIAISGNKIKLSQDAKNAFITCLENEYNRIRRVAQSIDEDKSGLHPIDNIIADYNDYTNEKSKLKGLKFWNYTNMLGDLANELENTAGQKFLKPMSDDQKQAAIEQIEKSLFGENLDGLGGMTGEFIDLMVEAGVITKAGAGKFINEMLPPIFFGSRKKIPERYTGLHLRPSFIANVAQFFINDLINTQGINELLLGDQSVSLKDFIDAVKRAKGANASGFNMRSDIIAPHLGIHERFDKSYIHIHKDDEYLGTFSGQKQKRTDAQMWTTTKAHRYFDFAQGRLTSQSADFIDRVELGLPIPPNDIFGPNGSIKNNYQVSVKKVVHYNRDKYIKTSMFVLTKRFTSYMKPEVKSKVDKILEKSNNKITNEVRELCNNNDNWLPWPGMEVLHNKRVMLENWENENKRVAFSAPESAAKLLRQNVGSDLVTFKDGGFMELDNSYWRLQTENPTNKIVITDPTQARQIIDTEQYDETRVIYRGNNISIGELRKHFQKDSGQRIFLKYRDARNQLFSIDDIKDELATSIDLNKVTPKLSAFVEDCLDNLQKTGASSQLLELFDLSRDPDTGKLTPRFDLNHPLTLNKYIQLFLAYFRSDVMSEKVPGFSLTMVSDFGVKLLKRVKRVDENNKPLEWEVIPRHIFERDPEAYKNIKDLENESFQPGDLFVDDLRYHVPEYDSEGNITGYYTEMIMPAHFKELLELGDEGIPPAIQKMFACRIPSQDKSFFTASKLVDFMPAELGSCAIYAKEIIELNGGDHDADKAIPQNSDFYIKTEKREDGSVKHHFTRYGDNAPSLKGQYEQYLIWNKQNNKSFRKTVERLQSESPHLTQLQIRTKELVAQKRYYNSAFSKGEKLTNENLASRKLINEQVDAIQKETQKVKLQIEQQAMQECGISTNIDEFGRRLNQEGELNIGVLNNRLLDAKIQLLTNSYQQQNGLLHEPGNLQPIEDIEQDTRIKPGIIEEKNIDIDNPTGKVKSFVNNKEGQSNIAPAVNSMLSFTFVHKYGIKFQIRPDVYRVKLNGHVFEGYENPRAATFNENGEFTGYSGSRIFTVLSAIVTAMTDNAKERKAAKLNLNFDAVGIVSNLIAQGFPKEEAIAMILSPAVKKYYKQLQTQKYAVRTGKPKSAFQIMRDLLQEYQQKSGGETLQATDLTSKMLFDNLIPDNESHLASYSTLYHFSKIIEQTEYFKDVSQILKLSKGLGTELEEWDLNIKKKADRLGLFDSPELFGKRNVPFDIREAVWEKHNITSTYLKISLQLEELSKSIIIPRSNLFSVVKKAALNNLNVPNYLSKLVNYQLTNHIILYFGFTAYLNTLEKRGDELLHLLDNRLIYDSNDGYKDIIKIVLEGKSLSPNNYLLDYLYTNPTTLTQKGQVLDNPNNRKGINTIEANTWSKLDAYQLNKLQTSFLELYSDPNTREVALGLFAYTIVKDGTMFRSGSLIQIIPSFLLEELLGDIMVNVRNIFKRDNLQQHIENNQEYANDFKEVFGTDFKGLIEGFYKTYLPHISNNFYLPMVSVGASTDSNGSNVIKYVNSTDDKGPKAISIDLFNHVRQKMWIQVASEEGITWEEALRTNNKLNAKELERFYKNKEYLQKKGFALSKKDGKWLIRLPYIIKVRNQNQGFDYYKLNSTHDSINDQTEVSVPLRDRMRNDDYTIWASKAIYIQTSLTSVYAQTPLANLFGPVPDAKFKKQRVFGYSKNQLAGGRYNNIEKGKDIDEMAVLAGMMSLEEYNELRNEPLPKSQKDKSADDFAGYTPDFFGIPATENDNENSDHSPKTIGNNKDTLQEKGYTFQATAGKFSYFFKGEPIQFTGTPEELLKDLEQGKTPELGKPVSKKGLLGKIDISNIRENEEYIPDEKDKQNPLNCKG